MISLVTLESIANASARMKKLARQTILEHDENAIDILEMLGLGEAE